MAQRNPPQGQAQYAFLGPYEGGQPTALGQVVLIQLAAAVDSLCPWPGFGQFGGAVMLRMGIVITRFGS